MVINNLIIQFGKCGSGSYSNTTVTLPTAYTENYSFAASCHAVNWTPSVMIASHDLSSINISVQRWTNASYCGDYSIPGFDWITIGY